jgi:hypothetical protein
MGRTVSGLKAGAPHALEHRVDRLQVARVRRHRHDEIDLLAAFDGARGAQVVLHVPAPPHALDVERAARGILELGEDLLVRLAEHVRHDVQPAAMCHADECLTKARLRGLGDDLVQNRHEHVQAFDGKARLAWKRSVQELLERLDLGQPVEQRDRIDRVGRRPEAARLDDISQPMPLFGQKDVREVVAGGRAVDAAQPIDDLRHRGDAVGDRTGHETRRERPEIFFSHAMCRRLERRITDGTAAERIDLGGEVAVAADGLGEVEGADRLGEVPEFRSSGVRFRGSEVPGFGSEVLTGPCRAEARRCF